MFIKRLLILFAACEFAVYVHGEGTASYSVVPLPQEIKLSQDNPFRLDDKVVVVYPESNPQLRRNAEFLSEYIGQSVGFVLPVKAMAGGEKVEKRPWPGHRRDTKRPRRVVRRGRVGQRGLCGADARLRAGVYGHTSAQCVQSAERGVHRGV